MTRGAQMTMRRKDYRASTCYTKKKGSKACLPMARMSALPYDAHAPIRKRMTYCLLSVCYLATWIWMPSGNLHKGLIGLCMLAVSKVQHSRLFSFIKLEVLRIDLIWFARIIWHLPAEDVFRCCWIQSASQIAGVYAPPVFVVSMSHLAVHFDLVNSMQSNAQASPSKCCTLRHWLCAGLHPGNMSPWRQGAWEKRKARSVARPCIYWATHFLGNDISSVRCVAFCAPLSIQ